MKGVSLLKFSLLPRSLCSATGPAHSAVQSEFQSEGHSCELNSTCKDGEKKTPIICYSNHI